MSLYAPRTTALFSALLLSVALPVSASAATAGDDLCLLAAADPAAFASHPEFDERLLEMAGVCDDLIFAMTAVTGSIPTVGTTPTGGASTEVAAPDYSDLMARLEKATDTLEGATADVERKQDALERTIRRAKRVGLDIGEIRLIDSLDRDGDDFDYDRLRNVLPDFTEAKRRALQNVLNARDALNEAEERLADAKEEAKPLVEKALQLSGLADEAQGDLDAVLGGLTADEMNAQIKASIDAAKKEADELDKKAKAAAAALDQVEKDLKKALGSEKYLDAKDEVADEEKDVAKEESRVARAQTEFDRARARLSPQELNNANSCGGSNCRAFRDARGKLGDAKEDLEEAKEDLEDAKRDLAKVEKFLKIPELQTRKVTLAGEIEALTKAEDEATAKAKAAEAKADELSKLLADACDALNKARTASLEAQAATAEEEQDVVEAEQALKSAMEWAKMTLAGSAEEEAALQAVLDAQAELVKALAALGAAQDVAEALVEEVAAIDTAPADVTEATEEMTEESTEGQQAAEEAQEALDAAEKAIADHEEATEALQDAVGEKDPTEPAAQAPGAAVTSPDTGV